MKDDKKNEVIVTNETLDLEEYYRTKAISKEVQDKIKRNDIIAIPKKYGTDEYYFAQETINFIKYCTQAEPNHSFDILSDGDIQIRSLHSFDIWMPTLWVASNILLPIVVNLISSYIIEKTKGREEEPVNIDVSVSVKDGDKIKTIDYHGDAKSFNRSFEKIDFNKL